MKRISNLLYIDEHLGCEHYIKENNVGFSKQYIERGTVFKLKLKKEFAVLFIESGRLSVNLPNFPSVTVSKQETCLLSNFMEYTIGANSSTRLTIMYFDRPNSRCDLLQLEKMSNGRVKRDDEKIKKLPMKKPLVDFINQMGFYLENKMYCRHLHDIKESEFFFVIRGFYTKEEITYFFAPVIKSLNDFTNMVHANYLQVNTVAELAELCNMTTKTFNRRFKSVFNETPKQWMMREKAKYDTVGKGKKSRTIIGMVR